jgi:hypothetical protein
MQMPGNESVGLCTASYWSSGRSALFQDTLYDPQNLKNHFPYVLMRGLNLVTRIQSPNTSRAGPTLRTVLSPVMQDTRA